MPSISRFCFRPGLDKGYDGGEDSIVVMTPADVESFEVGRDVVEEAGVGVISFNYSNRQGNRLSVYS